MRYPCDRYSHYTSTPLGINPGPAIVPDLARVHFGLDHDVSGTEVAELAFEEIQRRAPAYAEPGTDWLRMAPEIGRPLQRAKARIDHGATNSVQLQRMQSPPLGSGVRFVPA
ncbi:MAG: hypothetical protein ACREL7_05955 [Longimicrobiales bacterium]